MNQSSIGVTLVATKIPSLMFGSVYHAGMIPASSGRRESCLLRLAQGAHDLVWIFDANLEVRHCD
jgi:hypothetical protein